MTHKSINGFIHFWQTFGMNSLSEKLFIAKIMPCRVELKQATAHVESLQCWLHHRVGNLHIYSDARQNTRELLHIVLTVAAVHTKGVQLHQLACKIFVDVSCRVLLVVKVT